MEFHFLLSAGNAFHHVIPLSHGQISRLGSMSQAASARPAAKVARVDSVNIWHIITPTWHGVVISSQNPAGDNHKDSA
jgi:hypothetical protein